MKENGGCLFDCAQSLVRSLEEANDTYLPGCFRSFEKAMRHKVPLIETNDDA